MDVLKMTTDCCVAGTTICHQDMANDMSLPEVQLN